MVLGDLAEMGYDARWGIVGAADLGAPPDDFLCPTENGYGDYIIFKVDAHGLIKGWSKPEIEWGSREDDQEGWKRLKENDRA